MITDESELDRIRLRVFEFQKSKLRDDLNSGVVNYLKNKCNISDEDSIAYSDPDFVESIVKVKKSKSDDMFDKLVKSNDLKILNYKVGNKQ